MTRSLKGVLAAAVVATAVLASPAPAGAIVGGTKVSVDDHSYFAKLQIYKFTDQSKWALCGGSVIDKGWILTAAHCLTGGTRQIKVDVLLHGDQPHWAEVAIIHPLWNGNVQDGHDLAVLRIPSWATESGGGLPEAQKVEVGTIREAWKFNAQIPATMVGHGRTSAGGSSTTELRGWHSRTVSDADMDDIYNPWYGPDNWNARLMIGAGTSSVTICDGDSGGPLTTSSGYSDRPIQLGVASFVRRELPPGDELTCDEPGGYAELSGAQMAWVGATVPGVAPRWGGCTTNNARAGQYKAHYTTTAFPGAATDGTYYWGFTCEPTDTSAGTTDQGPYNPKPRPGMGSTSGNA